MSVRNFAKLKILILKIIQVLVDWGKGQQITQRWKLEVLEEEDMWRWES